MEEALRAVLLADPAVATASGGRVHWAERPQGGDTPAAVMYGISLVQDHHMRGPDAVRAVRVQVDCIGLTYGAAKSLQRAVIARLDGYRGVQGAVRFHGVFLAGARDLRDAGADEAERFHRAVTDFMVHHSGV